MTTNEIQKKSIGSSEYLSFHETSSNKKGDKGSSLRKKIYKGRENNDSKCSAVISIFRGKIINDFTETTFRYDIIKGTSIY